MVFPMLGRGLTGFSHRASEDEDVGYLDCSLDEKQNNVPQHELTHAHDISFPVEVQSIPRPRLSIKHSFLQRLDQNTSEVDPAKEETKRPDLKEDESEKVLNSSGMGCCYCFVDEKYIQEGHHIPSLLRAGKRRILFDARRFDCTQSPCTMATAKYFFIKKEELPRYSNGKHFAEEDEFIYCFETYSTKSTFSQLSPPQKGIKHRDLS